MNQPEFRQEARKLRAFLEKKTRRIASAKRQLKQDAEDGGEYFEDARGILGRAAEMAGENEITPLDLARAIQENPSATVLALNGLRIEGAAKEDDLYHPKQAAQKEKEQAVNRAAVEISGVSPPPQPVKPVQKPAPQPVKPVQKPAPQPVKPVEKPAPQPVNPPQKPVQGGDYNHAKLEAFLRELAERENQLTPKERKARAKQAKKEEKRRRKNWKRQGRRSTKIGLITWRGGLMAASIQYLLLVLLIPAAILFALEHFTGAVRNPPTPWAAFGVRTAIQLWAFFVARALIVLIRAITTTAGGAGLSVSLFLRSLTDLGLIAGTMHNIAKAFWGYGITSPEFPTWLKITGGVLAVLVLAVCTGLYSMLGYSESQKRKSIKYGSSQGRVGQVMLQNLTRQMVFPTAALVGIWAYQGTYEDWQIKALWILGFLVAWMQIDTVAVCLSLGTSASWYGGPGEGFFKFVRRLVALLFIPLLVLFLHWLFGWFPMQLWVMIVLGVYTLIAVIAAFAYARN